MACRWRTAAVSRVQRGRWTLRVRARSLRQVPYVELHLRSGIPHPPTSRVAAQLVLSAAKATGGCGTRACLDPAGAVPPEAASPTRDLCNHAVAVHCSVWLHMHKEVRAQAKQIDGSCASRLQ